MIEILSGCLWCGERGVWLYGWPVMAEDEWQFSASLGIASPAIGFCGNRGKVDRLDRQKVVN
jgi:hypothetical protein